MFHTMNGSRDGRFELSLDFTKNNVVKHVTTLPDSPYLLFVCENSIHKGLPKDLRKSTKVCDIGSMTGCSDIVLDDNPGGVLLLRNPLHAGLKAMKFVAGVLQPQPQLIHVFSHSNRLCTEVLFGGAMTSTTVLVDTGSAEFAVCNQTDMGSAKATGKYAACSYGENNNGWVGEWYEGIVTFGSDGKSITDSKPILAARIQKDTSGLCNKNPNIKGILGINFGGNDLYDNPQKLGKQGQTSHVSQKESFASTMLNKGDDYTMAFIGVTTNNSSSAVIAFGATAKKMLSHKALVGSTPIQKHITDWYTITMPITVSFKNVKGLTKKIEFKTSTVNEYPIIDSGVTSLVLPNVVRDAVLKAGLSFSSLPYNTIIVVEMPGGLTLELPLNKLGNNIEFGSKPILGFPIFCLYDIEFQTKTEILSFYYR